MGELAICGRCGELKVRYRGRVCEECFGRNVAEYRAEVLSGITEHGWILQGVMGSESSYSWCYTVGLARMGLAELVMTSLPMETMSDLLNRLATRIVAGTLVPVHGAPVTVDGYEVEFRFVVVADPNAEYPGPLSIANLTAGRPVVAFQVAWPDDRGRWPWDVEFGVIGVDGKPAQPLWGPAPTGEEIARG